MPAGDENVIHQLAVGDAATVAEIVERAQTSDDVTTLVSAALFAPDSTDLLRRAAPCRRQPATARSSQSPSPTVAADVDLVDVLARDHLSDHPTSVLVAWISAHTHPNTTHPKATTRNTDAVKGSDVSHLTFLSV